MKIPEQAKKVFTGKIFEIYQWEQKMYDGSTAIFERAKRTYTVQILPVTEDGKIILIEDEQPDRGSHWTLCAGRMEPNEQPLDAAKRELLEETGYASDEWELYSDEMASGKIDWVTYVFIAKGCKKIQEPKLDAGEKVITHLCTFEEFAQRVADKDFHATNFVVDFLRKAYHGELDEFRKKLFGN